MDEETMKQIIDFERSLEGRKEGIYFAAIKAHRQEAFENGRQSAIFFELTTEDDFVAARRREAMRRIGLDYSGTDSAESAKDSTSLSLDALDLD